MVKEFNSLLQIPTALAAVAAAAAIVMVKDHALCPQMQVLALLLQQAVTSSRLLL